MGLPTRIEMNSPDPAHLPTVRDLAVPLFRYRRTSAFVFIGVVAAALVAAVLVSRTYEGRMRILVNRERLDSVVSSDAQSSSAARLDISENELYSEVELLTSRDLLEAVAKASGLVDAVPASGPGETDAARLARAVRRMRAALDARPLKKTTLIEVTYRSRDPQQAFRVLDELARLYLAKHLAIHRPPGARQFFADQTARLQSELRSAEGRLNEFTSREHVVSAAGERESTLQKLSEFEATLEQTEAAIADNTRRMAALDAELSTTPVRNVTKISDLGNAELLRSIKAQLLEAQLKRSDLLQKFNPQYPLVVELESHIAQLQAALDDAERAPLRDESTDQNPTYQWLLNERARVRTERDALRARADATRGTVALYRQRAERLDGQSLQQQELLRAVKTAEESYLLYQRKQEEARISDELDRTRIANVAVAEPPTVPQSATSPRPLILVGGLAAALFLAIAAAYLLHAVNPYFRTPDEVYQVLDVPVLASLPAAE